MPPEESQAPAPQAPQSPIAGIKAFLSAQAAPEAPAKEAEEPTSGIAPAHPQAPERAQEAPEEAATPDEDADEPEAEADEPAEDDAQDVEVQLSSLKDLADATELDLEKIMDLTLPTKIDGKEGTARIRDLVKSYQLDGHINQKLAALDTDRKTFETKRTEYEKAATERLQSLDQGVQILERSLVGEFESVDWKKLQAENPVEFNAHYVNYQQRFGQLQQLAQQIATEKQRIQADQTAKAKAWAEEQRTLLKAKIPEWSDDTSRAKDFASILEYAKGYGITKDELDALEDHRYALLIRDAWKYGELQKQKPATLKKVKAAPKLLKPGKTQSREARDSLAAKDDMAKLRKSGRVNDAAAVLKRQLFGTRK